MNNLDHIIEENYSSKLDDVKSWCSTQYRSIFGEIFDKIENIRSRMESQNRPITDTELEWVLVSLPLDLFYISERLNSFKLEYEVIKLSKPSQKHKIEKQLIEEYEQSDMKLTSTKLKDLIDVELSGHSMICTAYSSVISRVESEISFSRELIMGCKKLWDSRRRTEEINPVNSENAEITLNVDSTQSVIYTPKTSKDYIHGSL